MRLKLQSLSLELDAPAGIELVPVSPERLRASELRPDGAPIGELEVTTFKAPLIIDRDGVLKDKACALAEAAAPAALVDSCTPVVLPGISGYRAEACVRSIHRPALPYIHVLVLAPDDLRINGGLVITARSHRLEWPAGDAIIASLKVLGRRGAANE
ncbi:MAG: hypothetical protein ACKV2T_41710 [Kofleriaceae bacterium]